MIGIIGLGFVGDAILQSLKYKKIQNIKIYDKFKNNGIGKIDDLLETEFLFLCLPTPFCDSKKDYILDSIHENLSILNNKKYKGLVIIKSTIIPGTTDKLVEKYEDLNICNNPEFLSAKTAYQDFLNQKHIIIGFSKRCRRIEKLINFYKKNWKDAKISECTSYESESAKIFCNSFYAVKIQFFNELYLMCKKNNMSFETVRKLMIDNEWINPMHTKVPGTDGKLSYGGACFPKDTNALLNYLERNDLPKKVLEATIKERNEMRNSV
jgi:UDPglucose 6-dehydrogenase